jgi:hypothetical protein
MWDLDNEWSKTQLLPYLLKNVDNGRDEALSTLKDLKDTYNIESYAETHDLNLKLAARLYVNPGYKDNADFSKNNEIMVNKLSISNWSGKLYLNFDLPGVGRDESYLEIR